MIEYSVFFRNSFSKIATKCSNQTEVNLYYSLRSKMFDTVDFLTRVWPFVLLKKFVKYVKLYMYMKVYLTINQMIYEKNK
jgi:hypothetical protein